MAIQINTASVLLAAANISTENQALKNSYDDIDKAITGIKNYWNGSASDICCRKADYIKSTYKEPRYAVIDSFVRFMRTQVSENYEITETVVSTAADSFK